MSIVRWAAVAGLPLLVCILVLALENGIRNWAVLPRPILYGALVDTLLLNTLLVIIAAPVVGAALTTRRRAGGAIVPLTMMTAAFTAGSALVCLAGWGASAEAVSVIARSHATLSTAMLALSAVGVVCGRLFRHPLDGVACGLVVSSIASGAILFGGPSVADAPRALVAAGLLASPLVTTAAAADIDLFRTDVLYQVSPLAHVRLDYPAWQAAAGLYLVVALCCFAAAARQTRDDSITND